MNKHTSLVNVGIALAMAMIFAADMNAPLGLAVPFLYLLLALGAIGARAPNTALAAIAVLGPALAALKLFVHPIDGVLWFGQANRLIFSVLIWVVVGLEWTRRLLDARREKNGRELERLVEKRTAALHAANLALEGEIAERKQAEATIIDYTQRLHALTNQLVDAQEAERKALATELHDRIGQNLSALNLSLNLHLTLLAAQLPPAGLALAQARIRDSLALVEQTTEIVRGVMEELHPALLDQYGLDTALRWYGEEFSRRTGLAIASRASEGFPRLRSKVEMSLFRIAQEALINVAKHAGASSALVSLQRIPAGIGLTISDDGLGIAPEKAANLAAGSGWGQAIMAERVRSIGAELRIEGGAERGTRVVVNVPNGYWETE